MHQSTGKGLVSTRYPAGLRCRSNWLPPQDDVGIAWLSLLRAVSVGAHGLSHGMLGGAAYAGIVDGIGKIRESCDLY